jgi:hypothetical protein
MERTTWDGGNATATGVADPWAHHPTFLHKNASGVAMRKKIFGEGAERMVRRFREFDVRLNFVGPWMVAKESRYVEEIGRDLRDDRLFHQTFCKAQQQAERIAREFNFRLAMIPGAGPSTPRIHFLDCHVYVLDIEAMGKVGVLVEKMLDVERYKKWNTNNGGVALLDGVKDLGLGAILEEDEADEDNGEGDAGETCSYEEDVAKAGSASKSRADASRAVDHAPISFTTADIPQAFSCFSYHFSGQKCLVCDLQGVLDMHSSPPCFELTDPVIHYRSKSGRRAVFGRTDRGPKGITNFFKTHQCNELCYALMKEWINPNVGLSDTPEQKGHKRKMQC